jgi:uncharacterized protein YkuJ
MLKARFQYNQTDHYDVNRIWNYEPDGKSVAGVDYWIAEGGSFSFECEMDDTLRWLMNRERQEPSSYQIKYGIRKCFVQIMDNDLVVAEGYLMADSFTIVDHGNDARDNKVELVNIRVYDLLSCAIEIVKRKQINLVQSGTPYNPNQYDLLI